MFGFSKDQLVKIFADKFLEKDDKSLIAWYDENGKARVKVFKFDITKVIEDLKKENEGLKEQLKNKI